MDTETVLVKKKGRGIVKIPRPFPVGKYTVNIRFGGFLL